MGNIKFVNIPEHSKGFYILKCYNKLISATQNNFGGVKLGFREFNRWYRRSFSL